MTDDVRNRLKQQCLANLKRSHPDVDVSEDDIVVRVDRSYFMPVCAEVLTFATIPLGTV